MGMYRKPAFTLIEILVVVAIIALLVAILLPSLHKAREQARQAVCASNTHQMALALTMYTHEFGYYPGHHLTVGRWYVLWPVRLKPFIKNQHKAFWCPSADEDTKWDGIEHIVSDAGNVQEGEMGSFAYGYNDWGVREFSDPHLGLGGHINDPVDGEPKIDRIKRPSEMIAIADNESDGVWDTALDPYETGEAPGDRHSKGANVAFCDGHAQWYRQETITKGTKQMRRMWNNDGKNHCSQWLDLDDWPEVQRACGPDE
jgi:prepilin-type processing-associated H-X9-DG protein/prepilin-type N-terminal cleavage/methylation domain-containing protein